MENAKLNDRQYVSILHHIEKLIEERQKQIDLQFGSMDKALQLSKQELDRRLEALNELRAAVEKDRSEFVKIEPYDIWKTNIQKELANLRNDLTAIVASQRTWIIAVGVFLVILQIVIKFI